MKYKIITDIELLEEFIEWLPKTKPLIEKYYLSLFNRKKYCVTTQPLPNDKVQLKRFVSLKGDMLTKIKQLEIEEGLYTFRGSTPQQEGMVLYIMPNPRDMRLATSKVIKSASDMLLDYTGKGYNIHEEALSCIQQSKGTTHFVDFDIDEKNVDFGPLKDILVNESYKILQTRGGYHLLVTPSLQTNKKWHQQINKKFNVDQVGDQAIPVPGTHQGGFTPKFINL